jgi:hypothetical protein
VAKKTKKSKVSKKRAPWTRSEVADLRKHSKLKTPVAKIAKMTKRTPGAIRAKGFVLGIRLGHRR